MSRRWNATTVPSRLMRNWATRSGVANSFHQIGMIHQRRRNYEQALEYYDRSLKIKEELGDRSGAASSLHQIGRVSIELERYDDAFPRLLSALIVFVDLQSPKAGIALNGLKFLRARWGEEHFAAAWKDATGEDVPDGLKE